MANRITENSSAQWVCIWAGQGWRDISYRILHDTVVSEWNRRTSFTEKHSRQAIIDKSVYVLHCEPIKTHQNVFVISSTKTGRFWINLRYSRKKFSSSPKQCRYTTLWNLAFAFRKWTTKHTTCFSSHRQQNLPDSNKILYSLSWIYLPQTIINVFHLP